MKKALFILLMTSNLLNGVSQKPSIKGWDIKIDLSGVFLKTFGSTISNEEITNFQVRSWAIPGIEVDIPLGSKLSMGFNFTPSYRIFIEEPWSLNFIQNDGKLALNYKTPAIFSFNAKYYPFRNGIYTAFGIQYLNSPDYSARLDPIGSSHVIGATEYTSTALAKWTYKGGIAPTLRLGYLFVIHKRYLFDIGIQVPIIKSPFHQNISIDLIGEELTQQDIEIASSRVKDETFYYPVQFRIQLGLRF